MSERRAFASIVHAESGLVARHAQLDQRTPSDIPLAVGDILAALHGAIAVVAALRLRDLTGRGEHVDMSMLEAMVASDDYTHFAVDGRLEDYPTQGSVWPTVTGPLLLAGNAKHVWATLHAAFGLHDDVPEGADLADKVAGRRRAIEQWFLSHDDRDRLLTELDEIGLAWADLVEPSQVLGSAAFAGRPIAVEPPGPESRPVVRTPYLFSHTATEPRFAARRRGADNRTVLADWLGLDDAAIDDLTRRGILVSQLASG